MIYVLMFSGGKDSTALWLWARRTKLEPRIVIFDDTGNEHELTYQYVDEIERILGEPLVRVRGPETFDERVRRLRGFPSSGIRWCTSELKLQPTKRELDRIREETCDDVLVVSGVRAEESRDRAKMPEREYFDVYDCDQWRPLLKWTLQDVIDEHHRAGIPLNPLYELGAERVGCWPCINAGKSEIRLVADIDPRRIDEIRELEKITKNTMFSKEAPKAERVPGEKRRELPLAIDDAVAWSRTKRGGKRSSSCAHRQGARAGASASRQHIKASRSRTTRPTRPTAPSSTATNESGTSGSRFPLEKYGERRIH